MDAAGVWVLLLIGGFVVVALVGLAALSQQPRAPRPDRARLLAETEELAAHAAEVESRAASAAAAAVEAREAALAAERTREEVWAAQEAVERAYDEALRAALAGRGTAGGAPGAGSRAGRAEGGADRQAATEQERVVSRAALSAYRRGDISVRELREVFRRTGDWDPAQVERERAAEGSRIARAGARRAYDRAAAEARRADQAARIAEVAAQALVDEAAESAAETLRAKLAVERRGTRRRRERRDTFHGSR